MKSSELSFIEESRNEPKFSRLESKIIDFDVSNLAHRVPIKRLDDIPGILLENIKDITSPEDFLIFSRGKDSNPFET